jgi:SAM-dependent methyltransferase
MRPYRDIAEIQQFYNSTTGAWVVQHISPIIDRLWPQTAQKFTMAAAGYPLPFIQNAMAVIMPATQGVVAWPADAPNCVAVSEDGLLPLASGSVQRLLLVHALENTAYAPYFLQECWRVLAPEGQLLLVVPSRVGLWVRSDKTPFGHGQPYSAKQLRQALQAVQFVPQTLQRALYTPPHIAKHAQWLGYILEWLGPRLAPKLAGVLVMVATKQLYATRLTVGGNPVATENWVPALGNARTNLL